MNNAREIVVPGGGQLYIAPANTTLPDTPTEDLDDLFVDVGYITDEGIALTLGLELGGVRVFQEAQDVRRSVINRTRRVVFGMRQWNEETVPFAFGGGYVQTVSGGYKYEFPEAEDELDERAIVIDIVDGETVHRFGWARGNVSDDVTSEFQRGQSAALPVTFDLLKADEPGVYLTNSAEFAPPS